MKKSVTFLLLIFTLFSCTKEESVDLDELLLSNSNGWDIASITHDINSNIYNGGKNHYTNCGKLIFMDNNEGQYIYEDDTYDFIYYTNNNELILIIFYFYEISDYTSPWLFYAAYYGQADNYDYGTGWDDAVQLNVNIQSDYSLRFWNRSYNNLDMFLLKSE